MPLTVADVFNSNLFSALSLTEAVNDIAYVPTRLLDMNLFEVQGIPTTAALIQRKGDTLALVPHTPRGAPGTHVTIDRRNAVPIQSSHLQVEDRIYADEIQNVVGVFGQEGELAGVEQTRDDRLNAMSRNIDLTLEYHRLGAIQGVVMDADGTTPLTDLFDLFGISEPAAVAANLDVAYSATTAAGVIKGVLDGVTRAIDDELGGLEASGYHAFVGKDFFDALTGHGEVRTTYLNQAEAAALRGSRKRTVDYGGILFEDYRGAGAVKIADNEARVFPTGVPGLFKQLFSPADIMEAVNRPGLVKYSLAGRDPSGKDKFIDLEVQSNPITYMTRPRAARTLTLT